MPEVVVFHPSRFEEAEWIVHNVRELKTVVVDAGAMEPTDAQRLIDFVAGGIDGVQHLLEGIGRTDPPIALGIGLGAAAGQGVKAGGGARMAELHHAQAFGLESCWGHDPMPAHGDQAVDEPLQHDA
eukprot:gene54613-biopygen45045